MDLQDPRKTICIMISSNIEISNKTNTYMVCLVYVIMTVDVLKDEQATVLQDESTSSYVQAGEEAIRTCKGIRNFNFLMNGI